MLKKTEIFLRSLKQRGTVICHLSDATVMHCPLAFSVFHFLMGTRFVYLCHQSALLRNFTSDYDIIFVIP